MKRLKTLILSTHDYQLGGHGAFEINYYKKDKFDAKLVTLYSSCHNKNALFASKLFFRLHGIINVLYSCLKARSFLHPNVDPTYCFSNGYSFITAKQILRKCGFTPDVICLYWIDGFVSSKVLYDLHNMTKASIVVVLVDHFMLGGGCHYPCGCSQYLYGCNDCPALTRNKKLAYNNMKDKLSMLKGICNVVVGTTYDCTLASNSPLYMNSSFVKLLLAPTINVELSKKQTRDKWGLNQDSFVIMAGSSSVREKRKGFQYFVEALDLLSKMRLERHIVVLIAGVLDDFVLEYNNISIMRLGFLSFEKLTEVFRMSDVFVSTTIADSGPMMINYSVAAGRPVISFDVGIAKDIVIPNKTGYIASFKDSHSVAQGILNFYSKTQSELYAIEKNCFYLMDSIRNAPSYQDEIYKFIARQ